MSRLCAKRRQRSTSTVEEMAAFHRQLACRTLVYNRTMICEVVKRLFSILITISCRRSDPCSRPSQEFHEEHNSGSVNMRRPDCQPNFDEYLYGLTSATCPRHRRHN